jgi:predicted dehydrogenase
MVLPSNEEKLVSKLRVAQIGVTAIHAPMYRDSLVYLSDEAEIVGFWDPEPDSVETRSRLKPDVAHVPFYATIDDLLKQAKPDAVLISGTMAQMPAWIEQAANAGVHVWAEKPFAVHSSQLLPAKAAIEKNGLHFSCGYSWRFEPLSLIIKEAIDEGRLGKPYGMDIRFLTSSVAARNPEHWMFDPAQSGGGILNWLGCHWLDLMRFLTSAEVVKVSAIEANVSGAPVSIEDGASIAMQFDNGMIGNFYAGFFLPSGNQASIGIQGATGSVNWNIDNNFATISSTDPAWQTAPTRTFAVEKASAPGYGAAGAALLRAFFAAIRGEGESGFTIDDAINSLRIIEAAHESSKTGRAIAL